MYSNVVELIMLLSPQLSIKIHMIIPQLDQRYMLFENKLFIQDMGC